MFDNIPISNNLANNVFGSVSHLPKSKNQKSTKPKKVIARPKLENLNSNEEDSKNNVDNSNNNGNKINMLSYEDAEETNQNVFERNGTLEHDDFDNKIKTNNTYNKKKDESFNSNYKEEARIKENTSINHNDNNKYSKNEEINNDNDNNVNKDIKSSSSHESYKDHKIDNFEELKNDSIKKDNNISINEDKVKSNRKDSSASNRNNQEILTSCNDDYIHQIIELKESLDLEIKTKKMFEDEINSLRKLNSKLKLSNLTNSEHFLKLENERVMAESAFVKKENILLKAQIEELIELNNNITDKLNKYLTNESNNYRHFDISNETNGYNDENKDYIKNNSNNDNNQSYSNKDFIPNHDNKDKEDKEDENKDNHENLALFSKTNEEMVHQKQTKDVEIKIPSELETKAKEDTNIKNNNNSALFDSKDNKEEEVFGLKTQPKNNNTINSSNVNKQKPAVKNNIPHKPPKITKPNLVANTNVFNNDNIFEELSNGKQLVEENIFENKNAIKNEDKQADIDAAKPQINDKPKSTNLFDHEDDKADDFFSSNNNIQNRKEEAQNNKSEITNIMEIDSVSHISAEIKKGNVDNKTEPTVNKNAKPLISNNDNKNLFGDDDEDVPFTIKNNNKKQDNISNISKKIKSKGNEYYNNQDTINSKPKAKVTHHTSSNKIDLFDDNEEEENNLWDSMIQTTQNENTNKTIKPSISKAPPKAQKINILDKSRQSKQSKELNNTKSNASMVKPTNNKNFKEEEDNKATELDKQREEIKHPDKSEFILNNDEFNTNTEGNKTDLDKYEELQHSKINKVSTSVLANNLFDDDEDDGCSIADILNKSKPNININKGIFSNNVNSNKPSQAIRHQNTNSNTIKKEKKQGNNGKNLFDSDDSNKNNAFNLFSQNKEPRGNVIRNTTTNNNSNIANKLNNNNTNSIIPKLSIGNKAEKTKPNDNIFSNNNLFDDYTNDLDNLLNNSAINSKSSNRIGNSNNNDQLNTSAFNNNVFAQNKIPQKQPLGKNLIGMKTNSSKNSKVNNKATAADIFGDF